MVNRSQDVGKLTVYPTKWYMKKQPRDKGVHQWEADIINDVQEKNADKNEEKKNLSETNNKKQSSFVTQSLMSSHKPVLISTSASYFTFLHLTTIPSPIISRQNTSDLSNCCDEKFIPVGTASNYKTLVIETKPATVTQVV